jgi:hypothetical protein
MAVGIDDRLLDVRTRFLVEDIVSQVQHKDLAWSCEHSMARVGPSGQIPRTQTALIVTCAILLGCTAGMAVEPRALPSDYCLSGFCPSDDTAKARKCFGQPDSLRRYYHRVCADTLTDWFYRGLKLVWSSDHKMLAMDIDSSNHPLSRGLKVGDSAQAMVRLFGEPTRGYKEHERTRRTFNGQYVYEERATGHAAGPSLIFYLNGEQIRFIYIGWLCE